MKKEFVVLILLLVSVLLISGCAEKEIGLLPEAPYQPEEKAKGIPLEGVTVPKEEVIKDEIIDWKVYKNEKYGFEIKYPLEYSAKETLEDGSIVSFGTFKPSPATGIPVHYPYLVIWVLNNPRNHTLEEFYNFYSLPENKELHDREVGKRVYNYYESPDSIESIEINGISAVKFIIGGDRMVMSIPGQGKIFEIQARMSAEGEKTFNQMLSTFKFVSEAPAKFIPEHCVISAGSGLACENFRTTAGTGITLRIKNILSENVFVDSIILDSPSCTFSTTTEIIVGATTDFLLSCPSIELGDKIKATISINYKIGDSDLKKETTGDLNAKVV